MGTITRFSVSRMLKRSGARRLGATMATTSCPRLFRTKNHGRTAKRFLIVTRCEASGNPSRLIKGTFRVYAISDLHTHYKENLSWVRQLSKTAYQEDIVIVAGDISDDFGDLRETFFALKERFGLVFFCTGNHELWVTGQQRQPVDSSAQDQQSEARSGAAAVQPSQPAALPVPMARDSLEKLALVMALCEEMGVLVAPTRLGRLKIIPLLAWHHKAFDCEPDIPGIPQASALTIVDYARCVWPDSILTELQAVLPKQPLQPQQPPPQPPRPQQLYPSSGKGNSSGGGRVPDTMNGVVCGDDGGGTVGFGADWGRGGHGSSAIAAWFDALNDVSRDWQSVSRSCSSKNSCSSRLDQTAAKEAIGSWGGRASGSDCGNGGQLGAAGSGGSGQGGAGSGLLAIQMPYELGGVASWRAQQTGMSCKGTSRPAPASTPGFPTAALVEGVVGRQGGLLEQSQQQAAGDFGADDVISFSHFLPLQELLPEKRFLAFPNLAKAVGSTYLGARVRRLRPNLHVFGHTHFAWDAVHDGTRYVQAPLAYPSERRFRLRSLSMMAEGASKGRPAVAATMGGGRGGGEAGGAAHVSAGISVATTSNPASNIAVESAMEMDDLAECDGNDARLLNRRIVALTKTCTSSPEASGSEPPQPPPPRPQDEQQATEQRLAAMTLAAGTSSSPSQDQGEDSFDGWSSPRPPPPSPSHPPFSAGARSGGIRRGARESGLSDEAQAGQMRMRGPEPGQESEGLSDFWPTSLNPGDAGWLPLCIYRVEYAVRVYGRGDGEGGGVGTGGARVRALGTEPPEVTVQLLMADGSRGPDAAVEVEEWKSQWCPEQEAMWSSYYKRQSRRPNELQLAPWVAERYSHRLRRNVAKQALPTSPHNTSAKPGSTARHKRR